jgi:hypothetical protein
MMATAAARQPATGDDQVAAPLRQWTVMRTAACLGMLLLAGTASLRSQDGPDCSVQTVDGRTLLGKVRVGADGKVHVTAAGGAVTELAFGDLMLIDQSASVQPGAPWRGSEAWLRSGMRLPFVQLRGVHDADKGTTVVAMDLPCGVGLEVALGQLQALRFSGEDKAPVVFRTDLQSPNATADFLYVDRDGKAQRFSVGVEHLAGQMLHFSLRNQGYDVELDRVQAVVFGVSTGFAPDRQPKPRSSVTMATGEHLEGRVLALDATCKLRLDEGAVLDLPRDKVVRVAVVSDKLTWLSELKPQVEQVPAFDRVWPWTVDRTPFGPGIRLGGQDYEHGICMVPRARLTYDLGGRFDVFEAMVGIDDRGGPEANAIFRVLADGKPLFESEPMTLGKPPMAVKLQLQKCKQLVLEADFGKNYDLGDLCVFANARVVQQ